MEEMRGKVKKVLIFGLSSLYAGVEALILNYVNHLDENDIHTVNNPAVFQKTQSVH